MQFGQTLLTKKKESVMSKQATNQPVQLELELDGSSLTDHFNDYVKFAISLSPKEFYSMKDDNPSFPLIGHIRDAYSQYQIKENVAREGLRRKLEYIRDKFGIR